jgi:chorismate dehydratase
VNRPLRIGAVGFLNARPLVYGLEQRGDLVSLRFDLPSVCARLLEAGEIDLGLVPSIAYLDREGDRVVPGVCIGSDGDVASVALYASVPLSRVQRVAIDTSSRTSAVLTEILFARHFGGSPEFVPHEPDLDGMLRQADAALLIGDPALFVDTRAHGARLEKVDLGREWTAMTGLPFVWAFWAGPARAGDPDVIAALQQSARDGMAHADAVANAFFPDDPVGQAIGRRYLRDNLRYEMSDRMLAGLRRFYEEAHALGRVARTGPIEFFGA